jgi:8-oxo-dGTP pyrophosphatase MutT (NUDIX family)
MIIIRVYGININERNEVLLTRERYGKTEMLKFPGGGMEFGEGTVDTLRREIREEFGLSIKDIRHFYTTDFFVASAFHEKAQILSIYYTFSFENEVPDHFSSFPSPQLISLLRVPVHRLDPEALTFPIDRQVARMLKEKGETG